MNQLQNNAYSGFNKFIVAVIYHEKLIMIWHESRRKIELETSEIKSKTIQALISSNLYLIEHLVETNPTSPRSLNYDIIKILKCSINGLRSRELISAVHSKHSQLALDLLPIYWSCHSQKIINRSPFIIEGDPNKEEKI
ncbi:hypothetical protein M5K25_009241 [Dendrobium thyrsiflorum]|uniref:Uncharacterized protein n=1 Tax=Dendrobium thyrsiflorum TaxID=117978 RepID=A0ABD0V510_DENTH